MLAPAALIPVWFAIAGIALAGGIFGLSAWLDRKRAADLERAAGAIGFSFERKGAAFQSELDRNLYLLRRGRRGKAANVMRGPSGALLFDYRYVVSDGRSNRRIDQTVAAFRFAPAALPEFHLGHENVLDRIAAVLGFKQIRFDERPEFGKRYLLRGSNENAVRSLFNPALVDYFQTLPAKPVWNVEAAGQWLLVYHPGKRTKPEDLGAFAEATRPMADQIARCAGLRREAAGG